VYDIAGTKVTLLDANQSVYYKCHAIGKILTTRTAVLVQAFSYLKVHIRLLLRHITSRPRNISAICIAVISELHQRIFITQH
jgi:hypothetical protein